MKAINYTVIGLAALLLALAAQSTAAPVTKRVMPWMCLERCGDTAEQIQQQLDQIRANKDIINVVAFELYNLGANSQLVINNLTMVAPPLVKMGVETYAMISSYPYPPEFMQWMRQLFANPDVFIDKCIAESKKWGFTGYNVDFEPTDDAKPEDGMEYAKFLDYFAGRMHQVGKKINVDVAGWSPVWNYTALAQTRVDRLITMSTYTGNFTGFERSLQHALNELPHDRYGCGLETLNESAKPKRDFTYEEMLARFQVIMRHADITEIDIWRMPVPDHWWPLLRWFSKGIQPPTL